MADTNLNTADVQNRGIRTTDVIIGFDPAQADGSLSSRTDTLTETILTITRNFPTGLTVAERAAIRTALGFDAAADARITSWVGAAPAALDTLIEIATRFTTDEDARTAVIASVTALAARVVTLETAGYIVLSDALDAVLAGDRITIDRVTGQITINAVDQGGGGTPVGTHTRRAAISTDETLSQAEYDAGTTSTDQNITMVEWTDGLRRFLFIGVPEDENDITAISIGGINVFGSWVRVAGVLFGHKWWMTVDDQSDAASGVTYVITEA